MQLNARIRILLLPILVLYILATVACGGGATTHPLPEGSVSSTGNPLVAQYTITTPTQATVTVEFGPDLTYGLQTSPQGSSAGGGSVTILVAGMKQNLVYHMRAIVTYNDGSQQVDADHTFQTGTIPPQRVPQMTVTNPNGKTPAAGVELLSLTIGVANRLLALATDPGGDIIWYYDYDASLGIPQPIKLLPNGHMLVVLYLQGSPGGTVREVDLAGNTIRQFDYNDLSQKLHAAGYNLQVFSIDHDIVLLPNGHLLLLVSNSRVFTDLPGYPGQTTVMGNSIVDLDSNSNPVWVWDAFDHLDVNRHPMLFPDWTHANALVYLTDDGNVLFSLRHQSWVLKIDYQNGNGSGDILWKLGYQGDFTLNSNSRPTGSTPSTTPMSPVQTRLATFSSALFDNGDSRVLDDNGTICEPATPPYCYSTAAIFEVNETARTANRQWSYVTPYSYWGGVTRVLPNSNIFLDETAPSDLNLTGFRIMEVTQDLNPTIVWQMQVDRQNSYRTIHLPSLYPGVQW